VADTGGITIKTGGFTFAIFIVLLILKLSGTVVIGWFWVFFPLWIGWALVAGLFLLFFVIGLLSAIIDSF
jgi:hypothetical protein